MKYLTSQNTKARAQGWTRSVIQSRTSSKRNHSCKIGPLNPARPPFKCPPQTRSSPRFGKLSKTPIMLSLKSVVVRCRPGMHYTNLYLPQHQHLLEMGTRRILVGLCNRPWLGTRTHSDDEHLSDMILLDVPMSKQDQPSLAWRNSPSMNRLTYGAVLSRWPSLAWDFGDFAILSQALSTS